MAVQELQQVLPGLHHSAVQSKAMDVMPASSNITCRTDHDHQAQKVYLTSRLRPRAGLSCVQISHKTTCSSPYGKLALTRPFIYV